MKKLITAALSLMSMVCMSVFALAGSLDSPGAPSAGSGLYSLSQIYDYLNSGIEATPVPSFQEPLAPPGPTMKTTKEIYDTLHGILSQSDVTADNVESGKKFFCNQPGSWGIRTGTLAALPRPTATSTPTPTSTPTATVPPTPSAGGEWVLVSANPTYGASSDFFVMKYEAKQGSGSGDAQKADSKAADSPWVSIKQYDGTGISAVKACANIGTGYHLCTVDEAQTINRNIEVKTENWADGNVGSTVASGGGLFRGNVNLSDSASCGSNVV